MELNDYEHERRSDRQMYVKISCAQCETEKWVRWIRVQKGQGRFCSLKCANSFQREKGLLTRGKENAFYVYDKTRNESYAHWKDADGVQHSTTYVRWLWEHVNGEIPEGYRFRWKDDNPQNAVIENVEIVTPEMFSQEVRERLIGHEVSMETKERISKGHNGSRVWRGFSNDGDYQGFSRWRKREVKERDGYRCQACGKDLHRSSKSRIHHIDGDKANPSLDNLLLVCSDCHAEIHCKKPVNDVIMSLRSKLV